MKKISLLLLSFLVISFSNGQKPVADFVVSMNTICQNDCVQFTDSSLNNPTRWFWAFTGGAPATSTDRNPTVCFANAGSFDVGLVVSNANGSDTLTFNNLITVNSKPLTSAITTPDAVCANTASIYSVTNNPGSTYQWFVSGGSFPFGSSGNPAFVQWDSVSPGILEVVETNAAGCNGDTVSIAITINPLPVQPVINGPASLCADSIGTFFVANQAGSHYVWWTNNGASVITSNDSSEVSIDWSGISSPDTVNVIETDSSGCSGGLVASIPVMLVTCGPLTINSFSGNERITIYPNPAIDMLTVSTYSLTAGKNVILKNVIGETVLEFGFLDSKFEIDVSRLPAGIYFLQVSDQTQSSVLKFVKE